MIDVLQVQREAMGCRALLLEIVRRAAYDWVLYRTSRRMQHRKIAQDAFTWLFVEGPGHPDWEERCEKDVKNVSFIGICESLDLEPHTVRARIQSLTARDIQSTGRPPTVRRLPPADPEVVDTDGYEIPDGSDYMLLDSSLEEDFPPLM